MTANREKEHEDVYGRSFALYDKEALLQFIDYFSQRFAANGLKPRDVFAGKRCLDAGCGGGRGTLFMLMNGAAHVTAVDVSPSNVATTERNCSAFGFQAVRCLQSSLEDTPFADGEFDFVWCNGVIMHTANPDACLSEITRVLKVDGQAWIYVYGAGGLYWYLVQEFREILAPLDSSQVLATLQLLNLPARYIGEYMDDWKVPYLRAYIADQFTSRLRDLGYVEPEPLARGVTYDTSERRTVYPEDIPWLGDGDLRYLLTKGPAVPSRRSTLNESGLGTGEPYAPAVLEKFSPLTLSLRELASGNPVLGVLACARIQRELRDTLSEPGRIDVAGFEARFRSVLDQLRGAVGAAAERSVT